VIEKEYENILRLDQVVLSLGINPFCEKDCLLGDYVYKTSGENTAEKILIDDIVAKLITSNTYKIAMCKISDLSAKAVLEKIIIGEEKLIKALENSFNKLRSKSNKSPLNLQLQLLK
jgi:rubrerythrin